MHMFLLHNYACVVRHFKEMNSNVHEGMTMVKKGTETRLFQSTQSRGVDNFFN